MYVTLVFIHTPSDVHTHSPSPLNHVAISKEDDENQCDSELLEIAVRFVSLADSRFQVDEINVVLWWSIYVKSLIIIQYSKLRKVSRKERGLTQLQTHEMYCVGG